MDCRRLCYLLFIAAELFCIHSEIVGVEGVGVNYGLLGDNLPPPGQVIRFLESKNVQKIRIYDPNPDVLNALHGSGIGVIVGVQNEDLQQLSSNPQYAAQWVNTNIVPHATYVQITYILAGNEVIPGPLAPYVLGAIQNLLTALRGVNIIVPVSTSVPLQVLGKSYPPSAGSFSDESIITMKPIIDFLAAENTPLLVNAYPYFAYIGDPVNINLDYALFRDTAAPVHDGSLVYTNLLDAMVDATYSALEKAGGSSINIVVSESGWASAGNGDAATIQNAETYVNNLIGHVTSGKGTPKRPGRDVETYVFALFNEDRKPAGAEQNFGLFYPDLTEVYHVDFPALQ